MRAWKIGLIGTGWWSEKHLNAWSRITNAQVTALCDLSREKLARRGTAYGIPPQRQYDRADEMLSEAEIDIVDIVTGPDTHLALVRQAAAAGKHILCQKPFARTEAEAREMVELARAAGVRLMVAENWRWLSRFQRIKRLLDEGRVGKLHAIRYIHSDYYTPRMKPEIALPQPFFRDMPRLLFYEMGAHWYDTWRFLFGTPSRLYAETMTVSPYVRGEDAGIVALGYEDHYGYMDMSWATRQKLDAPLGDEVGPVHLEQLIVDGEKGTIKLYADGAIGFVAMDGGGESRLLEPHPLDHEDSHLRLQAHMIECIERGEPFQTSGEDNLATLRMMFGTYESAANHTPVFFDREERRQA
ncbi:Gfo/Idh/MocA family protein [Cohnella sp. JJ-181]|uniref:Gfo/Idh/MocA family protein n=1 Tax=Cohnella rhizoplanae TaxID=2974897 RepID=UPI0022FF93F5|nr:Gfo/Idh/MocA family oxidoreductase [Cohnella sp. JJ-181]CAI6052147.1 D-apiose dehydrogenase [Cohnella sp. JJ-181]